MGHCTSKSRDGGSKLGTGGTASASTKSTIGGGYTWESAREKKDPNDYVVRDMNDAVVIKTKVEGEQFNIENCTNCDIFILDHSAAVFIDVCVDCRIFIGPVESSIFVRECVNSSMIIAAQQFRMRECQKCSVGLFSQTEPVIEMSKDIRIGCFDFSYFSLAEQCRKAKLNVWCNKWWQVHDFNAEEGVSNWSILPSNHPSLVVATKSGFTQDELTLPSAIPFTTGGMNGGVVVLFPPPAQKTDGVHNYMVLNEFLEKARMEGWRFNRTRSYPLAGADAVKLLGKKTLSAGETVGVEIINSYGLYAAVHQFVSQLDKSHAVLIPQPETETVARIFFDVLKDEM